MSKPIIHARNSVRKFGGLPDDYIAIHEKMDSSKMVHAEASHRCIFHSAFGIYIIEDIFGRTLTNSDGKEISVRDVAEQHVSEDLGFIPSLTDWLHEMKVQPWMIGPSRKAVHGSGENIVVLGEQIETSEQECESSENSE